MKIIVAGGREFKDYSRLCKVLDHLLINQPDAVIVSGTARGVDQMGEKYAESRNLKVVRYPANWDKYGKRAGYIRNQEMADNADALIAFWDSKSNGTGHMIDVAKKGNLKLRVINY